MSLFCDLEGGTVGYIAKERGRETLDAYFKPSNSRPAPSKSKSKQLWLRSRENVPQRARACVVAEGVAACTVELCSGQGPTLRFWKHLYFWATHSAEDRGGQDDRYAPNHQRDGRRHQLAARDGSAPCLLLPQHGALKIAALLQCGDLDLCPRLGDPLEVPNVGHEARIPERRAPLRYTTCNLQQLHKP